MGVIIKVAWEQRRDLAEHSSYQLDIVIKLILLLEDFWKLLRWDLDLKIRFLMDMFKVIGMFMWKCDMFLMFKERKGIEKRFWEFGYISCL